VPDASTCTSNECQIRGACTYPTACRHPSTFDRPAAPPPREVAPVDEPPFAWAVPLGIGFEDVPPRVFVGENAERDARALAADYTDCQVKAIPLYSKVDAPIAAAVKAYATGSPDVAPVPYGYVVANARPGSTFTASKQVAESMARSRGGAEIIPVFAAVKALPDVTGPAYEVRSIAWRAVGALSTLRPDVARDYETELRAACEAMSKAAHDVAPTVTGGAVDVEGLRADVKGWCREGDRFSVDPDEFETVEYKDDESERHTFAELHADGVAHFLARLLNAAPALLARVSELEGEAARYSEREFARASAREVDRLQDVHDRDVVATQAERIRLLENAIRSAIPGCLNATAVALRAALTDKDIP
jgi:hypothetical protein